MTADEMLGQMIYGDKRPVTVGLQAAYNTLRDAGLTHEQCYIVTGMGRRHGVECQEDDFVLRKFAAGALSIYGVMGVVFGPDSPQHHRGHA